MAKIDELEERVGNMEAEILHLQETLAELAKERNQDNRMLMEIIGRLVQNTSLTVLANNPEHVQVIVRTAQAVSRIVQETLTK